jgi:hypothetical protein
MAESTPHTWTCSSCGRRVPQRAEACHCGMTRAVAEAPATVLPTAARAPRPRSRFPVSRSELMATMPRDVKALLMVSVFVGVAGLGWLAFGPRRPDSTPALLGHVDQGPPPAPTPPPVPRPPFKLPWWK